MELCANKEPWIERRFWTLLCIPIGLASLCIAYAAFSYLAQVDPPIQPQIEAAQRAPIASFQETTEVADTPILPTQEVTVEPAPATPIKTTDATTETSTPAENPAPAAPRPPAREVGPDPLDQPYVVPDNKPYLSRSNPQSVPVTAKPAPPKPAPKNTPAAPVQTPERYAAAVKVFVLKDGRQIQAASVSVEGESYSVEDTTGNVVEFLKSDVHLITSRR